MKENEQDFESVRENVQVILLCGPLLCCRWIIPDEQYAHVLFISPTHSPSLCKPYTNTQPARHTHDIKPTHNRANPWKEAAILSPAARKTQVWHCRPRWQDELFPVSVASKVWHGYKVSLTPENTHTTQTHTHIHTCMATSCQHKIFTSHFSKHCRSWTGVNTVSHRKLGVTTTALSEASPANVILLDFTENNQSHLQLHFTSTFIYTWSWECTRHCFENEWSFPTWHLHTDPENLNDSSVSGPFRW